MKKICSKCQIEKCSSEFYARRSRASGLMSWCKTCNKNYKRSPGGKLSAQKYSSSTKGKNGYRRYRNTDHGRAQQLISVQKYSKTIRGRLHNQQAWRRRRERKRYLDMQFTHEDLQRVYERFDFKCFNCGSASNLCIDHHRPLSLGYGLTLNNAVLLCRACNASKSNRMPEEFYSQDKLKSLECHLTTT